MPNFLCDFHKKSEKIAPENNLMPKQIWSCNKKKDSLLILNIVNSYLDKGQVTFQVIIGSSWENGNLNNRTFNYFKSQKFLKLLDWS